MDIVYFKGYLTPLKCYKSITNVLVLYPKLKNYLLHTQPIAYEIISFNLYLIVVLATMSIYLLKIINFTTFNVCDIASKSLETS